MKINAEILDEAAHWLIELNSGEAASLEARQGFEAWLRRSPEHLRAYLELLPGWEDGAALPVGEGLAIEELIARGLQDDHPSVMPLMPLMPPGGPQAPGGREASALQEPGDAWHSSPSPNATTRFRFRVRGTLALAASLAVLVVASGLAWNFLLKGRYSTGVGEQRTLALEDGSTINLNAGSRIRVRFTSAARSVQMLEGRALFSVAKDAGRPFVVEAGDTWVRAVGTQFDVNRRRQSTVVTVVEGTVAVARSDSVLALSAPKLLNAGQQVTVKRIGVTAPRAVAAASATELSERSLTFDDSTLGEVIEEFNRYNERRLVILTPELESLPMTATFSSPDSAALVRFLETQPSIRIVVTHDEIRISAGP